MLDDLLFLLIIVGLGLSVAYMRAQLIDAREHRQPDRRESD